MFSALSKLVNGSTTSANGTKSANDQQPPSTPQHHASLQRTNSVSQLHADSNSKEKDNAIQVAVRIRPTPSAQAATPITPLPVKQTPLKPANSRTMTSADTTELSPITIDSQTSTIYDTINNKQYTYDSVLPSSSGQGDVFDVCGARMVDHVLNGNNGCILCYGQTGSGKTYTMSGSNLYETERSLDIAAQRWSTDIERGLIPRILQYMFGKVNTSDQSGTPAYTVKCSFVEIYIESVIDLLDVNKPELKLKEHFASGQSKQIVIEAVKELQCQTVEAALKLLIEGTKRRTTGETQSNARSSRSHSIFIITLTPTAGNRHSQRSTTLHLVDLAGSEKTKIAKTSGQQQKEGSSINKSLSNLNRVLQAVQKQQQQQQSAATSVHIPYRDSSLTWLLRDSLSGLSKTCLIANISSERNDLEFTAGTLHFASTAKTIKLAQQSNTLNEAKLDMNARTILKHVRAEQQQQLRDYEDKLVARQAEQQQAVQQLHHAYGQSEFAVVTTMYNQLRQQLTECITEEMKQDQSPHFDFKTDANGRVLTLVVKRSSNTQNNVQTALNVPATAMHKRSASKRSRTEIADDGKAKRLTTDSTEMDEDSENIPPTAERRVSSRRQTNGH